MEIHDNSVGFKLQRGVGARPDLPNKLRKFFRFLNKTGASRMRVLGFILLLSISYVSFSHGFNEEEKDHLTIAQFPDDVSIKRETKYFLYEINFGEGFNLRRDVYMRVAAVVKHLRDQGL